VLHQATALAIAKAHAHGFGASWASLVAGPPTLLTKPAGIVGTHGCGSSSMALGFFVRQVAAAGLVGLALAQSPEYVAPHGSAEAVCGTNPLAVCLPSLAGSPSVALDFSTATSTWWGVMAAQAAGRPLPGGLAQDAAGTGTTDPAAVLAGGSLLPFDKGPKGSGLNLLIELLAGPLVGAAVLDKAAARDWGNLVVALDPELLGDGREFQERTAQLLRRVKDARRQPGVAEILLPGERGDRLAAARLAAGSLPVPAPVRPAHASPQLCITYGGPASAR
jgi:LDH2 family malate/lactate/ureidoglycolate dehydrogenase